MNIGEALQEIFAGMDSQPYDITGHVYDWCEVSGKVLLTTADDLVAFCYLVLAATRTASIRPVTHRIIEQRVDNFCRNHAIVLTPISA